MGKSKADQLVEAIDPTPKYKTKEYDVKKVIILTVLSTIAVISLFVATFVAGVNHQKSSERSIEARINAAVSKVSRDNENILE